MKSLISKYFKFPTRVKFLIISFSLALFPSLSSANKPEKKVTKENKIEKVDHNAKAKEKGPRKPSSFEEYDQDDVYEGGGQDNFEANQSATENPEDELELETGAEWVEPLNQEGRGKAKGQLRKVHRREERKDNRRENRLERREERREDRK